MVMMLLVLCYDVGHLHSIDQLDVGTMMWWCLLLALWYCSLHDVIGMMDMDLVEECSNILLAYFTLVMVLNEVESGLHGTPASLLL
jgi:hypothetical protein